MINFTKIILSHLILFFYLNLQGQLNFNLVGGKQIMHSAGWDEKSKNNFSLKASLEIPINKRNSNYAIIPNVRYQRDDNYYGYLGFIHKDSRFFISNYEFIEYGQLKDVRFAMDKYLFGVNFQGRIVKQLYMSIGSGISLNTYKNMSGKSYSSFHFYQIDLAGYRLKSNANAYYTLNLQYKFPIQQKVDIIVSSEFIKQNNFDIEALHIFNRVQYSYHFEIGVGYNFYKKNSSTITTPDSRSL